jgi:hypothetical protein
MLLKEELAVLWMSRVWRCAGFDGFAYASTLSIKS